MSINTYEVRNVWVVSVNEVWIPGAYSTEEAAIYAAKNLSDTEIFSIWRGEPNQAPLTIGDVKGVKVEYYEQMG